MSDKNRVITNGLFRKKMAELLGEDIINTPQFNDFQALDVSTFTREMDKLIDNPPWSGGGSGGAGIFFVTLTITGEDTATSDKTHEEIYAAFEAGQQIIFKFIMDGVPVIIPAYMVDSTNEIIAGILENIESHSGLTYGVRVMASPTSSDAFRFWKLESGIFYFSYTSEDGTNWTSSERFSDIRSAHEGGLLVRARAHIDGTTLLAELTSISSSEIEFCHVNAESGYIEVTKFTHNSSDAITVLNRQITT